MTGSILVRTGAAMLLAATAPTSLAPIAFAQSEAPPPTGTHATDTQVSAALASEVFGRDMSTPVAPEPGTTVPASPDASSEVVPEPAPEPVPQSVPSPAVAESPAIALPTVPAPDIRVIETQLLSAVAENGGGETVTSTNAIPYIVGRSCYNWVVRFDPVEGRLDLTEELRLPGPARNWGGAEGSAVNPQGSAAVTPRGFDAAAGVATAGWCVAKDDPVGSYRYIIRQGDREIARFDFTVGDLL